MGEFSLETLEPREVLRWFAALAEIPRGSGNTKGVSDFCVRFARERGLEVHRDGANNVVIIAPAAPGYEAAPPLVLQGHLDMVCAKEPGCGKDMAAEGIDLAVDGDWLYAEGTTLGADDGAAVAMILAALDDRELPHPRLEAVLTADEETGMFGMEALDVAPLQGRTVLNLDSESEGVFTVSCAGGARAELRCALPTTPAEGVLFELEIGGLTGGHSGVEIDRGRANANLLLGRALRALCG
jgi:dipeptidase D